MSDSAEIEARVAALERKVSDLYRGLGRREPGDGSASGESGPGSAGEVSPDQDPWIIDLVAAGRKVEAIRAYQQASGVKLKEAKRAIDRLEELHGGSR